jgi:methionyl-tRNA synthetase
LPESSEKIKTWLISGELQTAWNVINIESGKEIGEFEILFSRIDKKVIEEEKLCLL